MFSFLKNIGSNILSGLKKAGGYLKEHAIRPIVETLAGFEAPLGDIASKTIDVMTGGGALGNVVKDVGAKAWSFMKDWVGMKQPEIITEE